MGAPRAAKGPSHVAYYALVAILGLLILLCLYFFYYFINKVKELSSQEYLTPTPSGPRPTPATAPAAPYPVQPVVRDSATAMAKLCKQLPTQAGKGDTVFPTSTSPAAQHGHTGDTAHTAHAAHTEQPPDKAPVVAPMGVMEAPAVR